MDILRKNFKNKFIILTLCFTIIFSSINFKKVDAIDFVISPTVLAVVSTLAVGTGIALQGADDIYDIGRMFYDYVSRNNSLTWDIIETTFKSAVSIGDIVTVDKNILDICKGFFDSTFKGTSVDVSTILGIPVLNFVSNSNFSKYAHLAMDVYEGVSIGGVDVARVNSEGKLEIGTYYKTNFAQLTDNKMYINGDFIYKYYKTASGSWSFYGNTRLSYLYKDVLTPSVSIPYQGGYDWGSVDDKTNGGLNDLPLPIPGDLGDLLGKNPSDVWDKNYENGLVGNGDIIVPDVSNPSIGLGGSTSFPTTDTGVGNPSIPDTGVGDPSIPDTDINSGIWATIKDFVISLVVPSDTFWTDTWNGLYDNFTGSFPSVNMDGFNDLVTGEKKFPNIDINIMGVKGRVVNGDVINSIVDWLRPIIAGFMMLCLMFFNYRKIYKLIRNSEPFGGISPGTSDFSTGISEYSDNYLKGGK